MKIDGGPAFPTTGSDTCFVSTGMTLRDYFAAAASEGDIQAHQEGPIVERVSFADNGKRHIVREPLRFTREQAKFAYADAMLAEREK